MFSKINFFVKIVKEEFDFQYKNSLTIKNSNEIILTQTSDDNANQAFQTRSKLQRSPESLASQPSSQEIMNKNNIESEILRVDSIFEKESDLFEKMQKNLSEFSNGKSNIIILNLNNKIQIAEPKNFIGGLISKMEKEVKMEVISGSNEGKLETVEKFENLEGIDRLATNINFKKSDINVYKIKNQKKQGFVQKYVNVIDIFSLANKMSSDSLSNPAKVIKNIFMNENLENENWKPSILKIFRKSLTYDCKVYFIINLRTTSPFYEQNKQIFSFIDAFQMHLYDFQTVIPSLLFKRQKSLEAKFNQFYSSNNIEYKELEEIDKSELLNLRKENEELRHRIKLNEDEKSEKSISFESHLSLPQREIIKETEKVKQLLKVIDAMNKIYDRNSKNYQNLFFNLKINSEEKTNHYAQRESVLLKELNEKDLEIKKLEQKKDEMKIEYERELQEKEVQFQELSDLYGKIQEKFEFLLAEK